MDQVSKAATFLLWYKSPSKFFQDIFNLEPYEYQKKVLEAIQKGAKRIIIQAAAATGKTRLLAGIALWLSIVVSKIEKEPVKVVIISGSRSQAKWLYDYCREAFNNEYIASEIEGEPLQSITKFINGSEIRALPNSLKAIQGIHCLSEDTEILTENGWKRFPELTDSDKVATLRDYRYLEFQKPIALIYDQYQGNMTYLANKYVDILCTKQHRLLIKTQWKGWHFVKASLTELPKRFYLKKNCEWIGKEQDTFILPGYFETYHKRFYPPKIIPMDLWLEFLGFYLAEGSCENTNGNRRITITNSNPELVHYYKSIAEKLGFKPFVTKSNKSMNLRISDRQLYEYLIKLGKYAWQKYIPKEFKQLSPKHLEHLLKGLADGDGCRRYSNSLEFKLSSKQLVDDIGEIGLKLGYAVNFSEHKSYSKFFPKDNKTYVIKKTYRVYLSKNKGEIRFSSKLKNIRKNIRYKGIVYCVTVPNSTILVRRNGKTCWVGNSNVVIIDEAVLAGDFLIQDALRITGGMKRDIIILSGTPMDAASLFCNIFQDTETYPDWVRFSWTAKDCPRISVEQLKEAESLPEEVRQIYWEGKPYLQRSERVVEFDALKDCIKDVPQFIPEGDNRIVAGLDWGFAHYTAIVIVQKVGDIYRVLYCDQWRREQFEDLHQKIVEICRHYNVETVYADAENAGENQRLEAKGLNVEPVPFQYKKTQMQSHLRLIFHQRKIRIPQIYQDLIQELRMYNWNTKSGDDLVDALMLGLYNYEREHGEIWWKVV